MMYERFAPELVVWGFEKTVTMHKGSRAAIGTYSFGMTALEVRART